MAKAKSKLNNKSAEFIEDQILKENPDTLPEEHPVQVFKEIPRTDSIVFRNDRDPGVPLEFHYASATHPLKKYTLIHGETYNLPIEIIEHLEECKIPNYSYRRDKEGKPEMYIQSYKHQFTCKQVRDGAQRYAA